MSELLPCPFCGTTPRLMQRGGHDERDGYTVIHAVTCAKCGTEKSSAEQPFGGPTAEMAKSAAIRFWNARATPQVHEPQLDMATKPDHIQRSVSQAHEPDGAGEPVAWQARHPNLNEGRWIDASGYNAEHRAIHIREEGWEYRALYATPQPTQSAKSDGVVITDQMVERARDAWKASNGDNKQAMRAALTAALQAKP